MTKQERILQTLFQCLQNHLPNIDIKRNEVLSTIIPDDGLMILRDGDMGDAEILLSPPHYIYQHQVSLEVIIQHHKNDIRDQKLDILLKEVGSTLRNIDSLNDLIDVLHISNIETATNAIDGGVSIKSANISIILEYASDYPLA